MKTLLRRLSMATIVLLLAVPCFANPVNVFTVGASAGSTPLDPIGTPIVGVPIVMWNDNFAVIPAGTVLLAILAEGVDGGPNAPNGGEHDEVFVNGTSVGFLTQQPFYSPLFNLNPGPGALPDITAETISVFDITGLLVAGVNNFSVVVDPLNWVNEIEIAVVTFAPEPGTLALVALALSGLVIRRRRS